jgi:hypothetical protein
MLTIMHRSFLHFKFVLYLSKLEEASFINSSNVTAILETSRLFRDTILHRAHALMTRIYSSHTNLRGIVLIDCSRHREVNAMK